MVVYCDSVIPIYFLDTVGPFNVQPNENPIEGVIEQSGMLKKKHPASDLIPKTGRPAPSASDAIRLTDSFRIINFRKR